MKVVLAALAISVASAFASVQRVEAFEHANPSGSVSEGTLARMGMAGMETVSDQEGDAIRGKGYLRFRTMNFAFIWGRPVQVRQLILVGSKTSPAQAIGVSYNYALVW